MRKIQIDFDFVDIHNRKVDFRFPKLSEELPLLSNLPIWLAELSEEDHEFVRRFVLASGSLKELAEQYGVSYPTIRVRLDRLIERVKAAEATQASDPLERKIRVFMADGTIDLSVGRQLLAVYKASRTGKGTS